MIIRFNKLLFRLSFCLAGFCGGMPLLAGVPLAGAGTPLAGSAGGAGASPGEISFPGTSSEGSSMKAASGDSLWKAGLSRTVITPEQSMWMGGYAARDHGSEGAQHDLWIKALALEDARGERVVLITSDLLGIPKNISDPVRDRLKEKYGLSREQILLNSSHTHSGPALDRSLAGIYPQDSSEREKIKAYSEKLTGQIVELAGKALDDLQPARVYAASGVTRFQVNRRNNLESGLQSLTELRGPNDYAVPVIKIENEARDLLAIAFGYACHATVLNGYEWSGDYPGFAQLELEKNYPGVTALFFQGAGGDQNPLPRRSVALAQQYGKTLAAAVERVLNEKMRELDPVISTAYAEIELPLADPPSEEELSRTVAESSGYIKRWAAGLLEKIRGGESLRTSYPYPLQAWKLGDQAIMSLGGELVVEYAIELKRLFGQDLFVLGYSNDVMGYIPSETILKEGGYEGASSQIAYGLPGTWAPGIETQILMKMSELAEQAGIPKQETKILMHDN